MILGGILFTQPAMQLFLFRQFHEHVRLRTGVCLVTFSYSGFYEPSVVNAVEGLGNEFVGIRGIPLCSHVGSWRNIRCSIPIRITNWCFQFF